MLITQKITNYNKITLLLFVTSSHVCIHCSFVFKYSTTKEARMNDTCIRNLIITFRITIGIRMLFTVGQMRLILRNQFHEFPKALNILSLTSLLPQIQRKMTLQFVVTTSRELDLDTMPSPWNINLNNVVDPLSWSDSLQLTLDSIRMDLLIPWLGKVGAVVDPVPLEAVLFKLLVCFPPISVDEGTFFNLRFY